MNPGFRRITLGLIVLSLVMLLAGILIFKKLLPDWYFSFFPLLILIFFVINTGFFYFFYQSLQKSSTLFIRSFMLSTAIKLLIYLILILAYVLTSPKSAISFSVTLSLLYIAYTSYDLYVMLSLLKRRKEKNNLPNQLSN